MADTLGISERCVVANALVPHDVRGRGRDGHIGAIEEEVESFDEGEHEDGLIFEYILVEDGEVCWEAHPFGIGYNTILGDVCYRYLELVQAFEDGIRGGVLHAILSECVPFLALHSGLIGILRLIVRTCV